MAYSKDKAKQIYADVLENGVACAASLNCISIDSVKRAVRLATEQAEQPLLGGAIAKRNLKKAGSGSRVLAIGDLHAPFDLDEYFDHCCEIADRYEVDRVVFMGDVIDNHFSSYHETSADGLGGSNELDLAKERLTRWYNRFPDSDVIIGNHDRMIMRKAQTSAIPTQWIREYKDVLETPAWNFTERVVIDKVQYIHGEGGTARTRCKKDLMSTVQAHLHIQMYTDWFVGQSYRIFGCQVGCGIDQDSYAMAYAKNFPKSAIGCTVVIDGKVCINEPAKL